MTDELTVHLMIPGYHRGRGLSGTAAVACDLDGARGVRPPMRQRTLDPTKATCPECKETPDARPDR